MKKTSRPRHESELSILLVFSTAIWKPKKVSDQRTRSLPDPRLEIFAETRVLQTRLKIRFKVLRKCFVTTSLLKVVKELQRSDLPICGVYSD
jgi:hypothetical protein